MKKVIAIIDKSIMVYDESSLEKGCGGSETWTIQLSHELAKNSDYHIMVYCNCATWHFDSNGVEWVPFNLFGMRSQYQYYDYIIITRLYEGLINWIESLGCCKNIFLQSHDWGVGEFNNEKFAYPQYPETPELHNPLLKKIIALSNWHVESLTEIWNCIPEDKITIIPNGIDPELFKGYTTFNHSKTHGILWSSRPERGCHLICDQILPRLKKRIPDAYVNIASYDPIQPEYKNRENESIYCLGSLSKVQLYDEMNKNMVWFYPSIYPETFNISILKAVMCGNIPVLLLQHGMLTTMEVFKSVVGMDNKFYDYYHVPDGNDEEAIEEAVTKIAYWMNNYEKLAVQLISLSMRQYVSRYYSWSRVASMWFNLIEKYN